MSNIINFIKTHKEAQIALVLIILFIIIKITQEVLKALKITAFEDKNFFEALHSILFKRSYLYRQAKRAIKQGYYLDAGKFYEQAGDYKKAINTYEKGQEYLAMGELLEKLKRESEAIEVYKKIGKTDKIVELYLKRKNIDVAGSVLESNNQFQEAADLYYKYGRYEKAARIYERKGFYKKAAYIYEKAGNLERAALNFEKWFVTNAETMSGFQSNKYYKEDLKKAVALYKKLKKYDKAYELLLKNNVYDQAAEFALLLNKTEEAAKLFEKAQMPSRAAEVYEMIGNMEYSNVLKAEEALAKGKMKEAANYFLEAKDYIRAAELFEWSNEYEKAADSYFLIQNYSAAADNYLKAGNKEQAAKMYVLSGDWLEAAKLFEELLNIEKAAELYEKANKYFEAGHCYLTVENDKKALENFQKVQPENPNYFKAIYHVAELFLKNRKPNLVIKQIGSILKNSSVHMENADLFFVLAQAYLNSGEFEKSLDIFQAIQTVNYNYPGIHEKIKEVKELKEKYKELKIAKKAKSDERYTLIRKIGEGGMGTVWIAEDNVLKRRVAIKLLDKVAVTDKEAYDRFIEEARSTASLSHPNIVTVYDAGIRENVYFISMEYIDGENFMELLRKKKKFTIPQILYVAIKLLKALDYSHRKGIVHRDIKPHNIMITKQKEIKIMDFGLAVVRGEKKKGETGIITGTPYYMSPEQIRGDDIDNRTDIYSTGVTLFHLITGRVPFKGDNIFRMHIEEPVPDIKNYRQDVPDLLCEIVYKCMAKRREDRYQSAVDVINDIKKIKL